MSHRVCNWMMCASYGKNQGDNARCETCGGHTIAQHTKFSMSKEVKQKRSEYGF